MYAFVPMGIIFLNCEVFAYHNKTCNVREVTLRIVVKRFGNLYKIQLHL